MIDKIDSLIEFLKYFKDEDTCREYFEQIRFQDGEYCVHCGNEKIYCFADGKRYRCSKCKKDFTIKTKTVFGESKIPLQKWFIAIYLLTSNKKGISSIQLSKQVGVTQKTAWFMDHRIRKAMKQNKNQLFGIVEIDETYIGGKEKNKHFYKRTKGVQGRSTATKTPIMGLIQRSGYIKAKALNEVGMKTVEQQIVSNVQIGSQLITDDFMSYSQISKLYPHSVIKHGQKEYVRGDIHSNTIESFWALFKRGYHGTYHCMSKKHLQSYVDEFVYRFNGRLTDFNFVFSDMIKKVSISDNLKYKTLIQ